MSGKGKGFIWQDYQTAYETAWHGLIALDEPVHDIESGPVGGGHGTAAYITRMDQMPTEEMSQEDVYIKKDLYQALSQEAKEVIMMVLNAPKEILECFMTPKYDKISKDQIRK